MSKLGDLNQKVVLQYAITVSDPSGGTIKTWHDLASVWADIRPASATYGNRIGGTTTRRFIKIGIRDRVDLIDFMRVIWAEKTLDVLARRAIAPGFVELECEEVMQ